jgi:branched-chain amino acid transport system substrate-binding protein
MARRLSVFFLALLGIASVACSPQAQTRETSIAIGLEGPITGEQSSNGVDMFRAAQLAVDEANADGGVLGKHIELIKIDDKADPAVGAKAAGDAIARGIFAVVGPYNSAVGVANLPLYLKAGVIPIHLTSNSKTNGMGYTVQPKDYQIAPLEAAAITGYFKARRVAIVYDPQTYTEGIAAQVRAELAKAGIEVVAYESAKPGESSYLDLLNTIKAKTPDLLYASTYYPQGALIAREIAEIRLPGTCLMGLANQDPGFVRAAGSGAARACSSSGVPAPMQFNGATGYVRDYVKNFDAQPGTWGTFTYDSVKLLFDAVEQAGKWDAPSVRAILTATKGYDGITGPITIDPKTGNRLDVPVVILTIDADGDYAIDERWARFSHFTA